MQKLSVPQHKLCALEPQFGLVHRVPANTADVIIRPREAPRHKQQFGAVKQPIQGGLSESCVALLNPKPLHPKP